MKILIDELTEEPLNIAEDIAPEAFGGDIVLLEPVKINMTVSKSGFKVTVSGTVSAVAELECSRCLEKFPFGMQAEHLLVYIPADRFSDEENARLGKDDLSLIFYGEPVINLSDDVRQTIRLSIPLKPVCSSGCRGLCPGCGADLNKEDCGCGDIRVNAQFEKLKQLLETERKE